MFDIKNHWQGCDSLVFAAVNGISHTQTAEGIKCCGYHNRYFCKLKLKDFVRIKTLSKVHAATIKGAGSADWGQVYFVKKLHCWQKILVSWQWFRWDCPSPQLGWCHSFGGHVNQVQLITDMKKFDKPVSFVMNLWWNVMSCSWYTWNEILPAWKETLRTTTPK